MNRAERRRAEKAARKRQRWKDNVLSFHRVAKGALETYIVGAFDYPVLMLAGMMGHPVGTTLAQGIAQWASEAAEPDAHFLCLDCDQKFGPDIAAPAMFAITMPFTDREHLIVSGICKKCAASGQDLQQTVLRRLRGIWPDAYSATGGHA